LTQRRTVTAQVGGMKLPPVTVGEFQKLQSLNDLPESVFKNKYQSYLCGRGSKQGCPGCGQGTYHISVREAMSNAEESSAFLPMNYLPS